MKFFDIYLDMFFSSDCKKCKVKWFNESRNRIFKMLEVKSES